ncbi:glycosyltransferase [Testudinibacter aquarius]|uniref:Glycosyltransferase n=2 Tax=Testudinibacter aquarius TaxID=1524974 RepID=A0ABY2XS81_9PAST|nr:glycosyltransferase [Testudinibacter aquarius]KAE9525770.1 glycosyl transferase [Testudinibacter aquarius]TNG88848.1 glycosyltransferase [Testudinibacter aquarius]
MRILLIITGLGMGGAERQVCDLADEFHKMGNNVAIISLTGKEIVSPISKDIEIYSLNMKKNIFGLIHSLVQAKKVINKFNPDIVHSHMFHANLFARLLRIITPMKKLICTAHSTNEGRHIRMLAYRITDFLSDLNTNVSQEAVECFIQKGASPSNKMIPMLNGVSPDKFVFNKVQRELIRDELNITEGDFLFLAVGRLTDAKDYPNLLNAFTSVLNKNPRAVLAIVGQGEQKEELISLAENINISHSVYFLGLRRDIPALMSACDCFVLSSKYEGFGLVLAEAMLCERLVVATDCGGTKEVVDNYGYLVTRQNSNELANAMVKVINLSDNIRYSMGSEARKYIMEHYSLNVIATRWINLYQGNK